MKKTINIAAVLVTLGLSNAVYATTNSEVESCQLLAVNPETKTWYTEDQFGTAHAQNLKLLVRTDVTADPNNSECVYVSWTHDKCVIRLSDNQMQFRTETTPPLKRCSYYP